MIRIPHATRSGIGVGLLVMLISGVVHAKTTLDIQTGLDDRFRVGRWSPVFLTIKSDRPRTVIVELRVPNASSSAMTIRQAVGVNTESQKYVMYAPLGVYYDPIRATVFDADTRKLLAEWPARDFEGIDRGGQQIGFMMMTAGRSPLMQNLRRNSSTPGSSIVSHLRYPLLPAAAVGYDSADVLYLNNPDWSQLSVDQQRAMIDWTRAGGTIILFPGPETLPADAPLVSVLPCDLGPMRVIRFDAEQRRELQLPDRFKEIGERVLLPRPGAQLRTLPQNTGSLCTRSLGLGRIAVVSTDVGVLAFSHPAHAQTYHNKLLDQLLGDSTPNTDEYYGYYDTDILAANAALNRIGDIPNTGGFGFSYIALVVGGLMVIVGPVDWFILKKIGKQPWTWATTIGWVGVFTCGALYAGHLLRSGDLHFRTIQLIDQAGGRVVASEDIALIYAPRSAEYAIEASTDTWWQPVPSGNRYNSSAITTPIHTHQTYRGNTPEPMWIDVWNWRFLRGTRYLDQPPIIDAKLSFDPDTRMLTGTITNRSDRVLTDITAENADTTTYPLVARIEPGATVPVRQKAPDPQKPIRNRSYYNRYDTDTDTYSLIFDISPARSDAAERRAKSGDLILYASIADPTTNITITDPNAITKHAALLRAVIEPTR